MTGAEKTFLKTDSNNWLRKIFRNEIGGTFPYCCLITFVKDVRLGKRKG